MVELAFWYYLSHEGKHRKFITVVVCDNGKLRLSRFLDKGKHFPLKAKGRWGWLTDEIKWKWLKELEQFAVVFANEHGANFAICCASFAKSKERTRAPTCFPGVKGPIRRQTVRAKQAGHFPLFNCPTLK